jgi:hypothetical protein
MSDEVIIGAGAIADHEARRIWADEDRRASWWVGALDVPPEVDARLTAYEAEDERRLTLRLPRARSRRVYG